MVALRKSSQTQTLLSIILAASIYFTVLALLITTQRPLPGDVAILQFTHSHIPDALSRVFLTATEIGNPAGIIIIVAVIASVLLIKRLYSQALIVFLSVSSVAAINLLTKQVFHRIRPALWESVIQAQSFSFPSGHAMASSGLVLALIYITWRTKWRLPTLIIGGLFVFMVGMSRLYFGVHYPSDILGGWLASSVVVPCVILIHKYFGKVNTVTEDV